MGHATHHVTATVALSALCMVAACKPSGVTDAETRGNVHWLDQQGSPESTAALGRLADKNTKAEAALESRPKDDLNVYLAAWMAVERGAPWGGKLIHRGLAAAGSAAVASRAMTRKSGALGPFVDDLDAAIKAGCVECTGVLASAGAPAVPAVERRLADAATRGAMCQGLASVDAAHEARMAFTKVAVSSRDDRTCVDAATQMAVVDDDVLAWLGSSAETGLLGSAGKSEALGCDRLRRAWDLALRDRPTETYGALAVPLEASVARCGKTLDETLADALEANAARRALAVEALDAPSSNPVELRNACQVLRRVKGAGLTGRPSMYAVDALARCATARRAP